MKKPINNVNKILIIKFKHIGDVLLSVPTINTLKERFPNASIDYLLNKDTAPIVKDHQHLSQIYTVDKSLPKSAQIKLLWHLRRKHYDMTIDLSGGGDRGSIWSFLINAKHRLGTLPQNSSSGIWGKHKFYTHITPLPPALDHAVLKDLSIIESLGIHNSYPYMDMHIPKDTTQKTNELFRQHHLDANEFILIHPTSRWFFKCVDDAVIAEVVDSLQTVHKIKVILTCGPDQKEKDKLQSIQKHLKTQPVCFFGTLTLPLLASLISNAKIFLGVDSAPAHMAAALNTPSIVLFGPTGAYNWGPWPNHSADLSPYPNKGGGTKRAGQHIVIQKEKPCVPCGKAGCNNSKISDCLMEITANDILKELTPKLSG